MPEPENYCPTHDLFDCWFDLVTDGCRTEGHDPL